MTRPGIKPTSVEFHLVKGTFLWTHYRLRYHDCSSSLVVAWHSLRHPLPKFTSGILLESFASSQCSQGSHSGAIACLLRPTGPDHPGLCGHLHLAEKEACQEEQPLRRNEASDNQASPRNENYMSSSQEVIQGELINMEKTDFFIWYDSWPISF